MFTAAELCLEIADRELERRVATFLASWHFPSLRNLRVEAQGGTVVLQGRVGSYYEKQLTQQCCRRVAGVVELIDRVQVVRSPRRAGAPLARVDAGRELCPVG